MTVQVEIRRYITQDMGWSGDPETLTNDLDLIDHHIVDSLGVVELTTFLEQRYGITVEATDFVYDHFHSLNAIAEYIEKKRVPVP